MFCVLFSMFLFMSFYVILCYFSPILYHFSPLFPHFNLLYSPFLQAPYFSSCLSEDDLDEMHIEIVRNLLYKAYLEDFYLFCTTLGTETAETMLPILQFEADRRSINITINSLDTELSKDDRFRLYPNFGLLQPDGIQRLAKADTIEAVAAACGGGVYGKVFEDLGGDKSIEDRFFAYEWGERREVEGKKGEEKCVFWYFWCQFGVIWCLFVSFLVLFVMLFLVTF